MEYTSGQELNVDHLRSRITALRNERTHVEEDPLDLLARFLALFPLFPDQFIHVVDLFSMRVVHVEGFEKVLGFPEDRVDLAFITGLAHPEDRSIMTRISEIALQFMVEVRPPLQPFETSLLVDYRMRMASGQYTRVLRQSSLFGTDPRTGEARFALSVCRDIGRIKSTRTICWQCTGRGADVLGKRLAQQKLPGLCYQPTPREMEIIKMLVEGRNSKLISRELGITLNTVSTHRRNILDRIGLKNTAELVRLAMDHGWV